MKKFFMGLILGAGLMIGVSAHAEVVNLVGKVIEGQFPVKVDGKTVEVPGIVIEGTSYLPTRTIAELTGYDVSFNADMGVELKRKLTSEPNLPTKQVKEEPKVDPERRIESIDDMISALQRSINMSQTILDTPGGDEATKQREREAMELMKSKIAELEAEKAELEAQLSATPE